MKKALGQVENSRKLSIHGVGRRKKAVARVWLKKGSGAVLVNNQPYDKYFDTNPMLTAVEAPLQCVKLEKDFDANVNVSGGGKSGQAEAVRLGIARALVSFDEALKGTLRKNELLTVDDRVKERKKYGQRGARRKFQFVKR